MWNNNQFSQFESGGGHGTSEISKIIAIAISSPFDDPVHPQAFEQAGDLAGIFVGPVLTQHLVGETLENKLTIEQETKQKGVLLSEEIEAFVTVIVLLAGFSQMLQIMQAGIGGVDVGDKLQIAFVNGL